MMLKHFLPSNRLAWPLQITTAALITLAAIQPDMAQEAPVKAPEKAPEKASAKASVEKRTYFFEKAAKQMEYALYVPKSYDKTKKHPLLVVLHSWKSTPHKVIKYKGITVEAEKRGFVVVAPYGYNERGWYGSQGKGKKSPWGGQETDPENLAELSELDVLNVLEIVQKEFSIDQERIYLMGHAMGGGGTLHLAATHPTIWAGIAPLSPQFYADQNMLRKSRHIPTIVVTGADDEHVKVERVRKLVAQMKKSNTTHRYIEIEEGDHYHSIARNPEMISEVFDFFDGKYAGEDKALGEVFRNFTNSEGKTIEANLITATEENVTIKRKKDGNTFTLPIASLSEEDQTYIEEWVEKNSEKMSKAALQAAFGTEPDPELEAKIIERLEIDSSEPEEAIEILSIEIEEKENEINAVDDKVGIAFRRGDKNAGRKLQVEALASNEELKTLRGLRAELKNAVAEGKR
jgi:poly(3-hydroxybutyrate) depolymerase